MEISMDYINDWTFIAVKIVKSRGLVQTDLRIDWVLCLGQMDGQQQRLTLKGDNPRRNIMMWRLHKL